MANTSVVAKGVRMDLPDKLISNLTTSVTNFQPSFTGIPESLRSLTIANVVKYTAFNSIASIAGAAPNFFAALLTMGKLVINRIEYSDSINTKNINLLMLRGGLQGDQSVNVPLIQDYSVSSSNIVCAADGRFEFDINTGFTIVVPVATAVLALYIDSFEPYN